MPRKPEYVSIAEALKAEVLAGSYSDDSFPGNGAIAERFDVNMKTAGRAVQQLVAEGVLIARSGRRAMPVSLEQLQTTNWPMTGRYARARAAQGLVFSDDVSGIVRKDTISRDWVESPSLIAQLLDLQVGVHVFRRRSRTYIDNVATEDTAMFFPAAIVSAAPRLESDDRIQVVGLIEEAGYVITRTTNELRARHALPAEQDVFKIDAQSILIEHTHGTYGADGEALEAVINIRPAKGNVITFDTYEAPINDN